MVPMHCGNSKCPDRKLLCYRYNLDVKGSRRWAPGSQELGIRTLGVEPPPLQIDLLTEGRVDPGDLAHL